MVPNWRCSANAALGVPGVGAVVASTARSSSGMAPQPYTRPLGGRKCIQRQEIVRLSLQPDVVHCSQVLLS